MRDDPNPAVEHVLGRLRVRLALARATPSDYVLFGSVALYLHGLRSGIGDVDLFVAPHIYLSWRGSGDWQELWPRENDPPMLELAESPPVHAFKDWTDRDAWMSSERCFDLAEEVHGWMCIPLAEVARQKQAAFDAWDGPPEDQEKHVRDIELLQRHGVVSAR